MNPDRDEGPIPRHRAEPANAPAHSGDTGWIVSLRDMAVVLHVAAEPDAVRDHLSEVSDVLARLSGVPQAGSVLVALRLFDDVMVEPWTPELHERLISEWLFGRYLQVEVASAGEMIPFLMPGGPYRWGLSGGADPDDVWFVGVRVPFEGSVRSKGHEWLSALRRLHDLLSPAYGMVAVDRLWTWTRTSLEEATRRGGGGWTREDATNYVRGYHWADLVTPAQYARLDLSAVGEKATLERLGDGSVILSGNTATLEPLAPEDLRWRSRAFRPAIHPMLADLPLTKPGFAVDYGDGD